MSDSLKWILLGALSLVFGFLALNFAVLTSLSVTFAVGALFVVAGIAQGVAAFRDEAGVSKALAVLLGVVMVVLGGSFLLDPFLGTIALSIAVTAFIAASGILRLIQAWQLRGTPTFWMMGVAGVASLALATFIVLNPQVTPALLGIVLGVELVVNGAALIALGWHRRGRRGRGGRGGEVGDAAGPA